MADYEIPQNLPYGQPSPVRVVGDAAFVAIGHGFEVVVDLSDLPIVEGGRWLLLSTPTGHAYAYRRVKDDPIQLMHRVLLSAPKGTPVDHVDGDGLNNRRSNIRLCTPTLNQANKIVERRNKLGLKGVDENRPGKFRATIKPDGKSVFLGSYATKEEAAAAYRGAARVLWGAFAKEPA